MLVFRITGTIILRGVNEVVDTWEVLLICWDRKGLLLLRRKPSRHWLLFTHSGWTGLIEGGVGLRCTQSLRGSGLRCNRGYRIIEAPRRGRGNRTGGLAGS